MYIGGYGGLSVSILCPAFCLKEARWWLQLEVTSNLHYIILQHYILIVLCFHTTDVLPQAAIDAKRINQFESTEDLSEQYLLLFTSGSSAAYSWQ